MLHAELLITWFIVHDHSEIEHSLWFFVEVNCNTSETIQTGLLLFPKYVKKQKVTRGHIKTKGSRHYSLLRKTMKKM